MLAFFGLSSLRRAQFWAQFIDLMEGTILFGNNSVEIWQSRNRLARYNEVCGTDSADAAQTFSDGLIMGESEDGS